MQSYEMRIRSRLYSSRQTKPMQVAILARCWFPPRQAGARYPIAESVMDCPATQAYVHDCLVKVVEGRQVHRFRVYFKRHRYLPTSRSLAPFRGDVVVIRAGVIHPLSVVNMRGRDITVSDFMISK